MLRITLLSLLLIYSGILICDRWSYNSLEEIDLESMSYFNKPISYTLPYSDSLKTAAINGDAMAQTQLGWSYLFGLGIKPDKKQSKYWLELAAASGLEDAQYRLGLSYCITDRIKRLYAYKGIRIGGSWHYNKAMPWFLKAGIQRYPPALHALGNRYNYGQGVNYNEDRELMCYLAAADSGYAPSQFELGQYMYNTAGGETDRIEKALDWYSKAAEKGHLASQFMCGNCCYILKDMDRAYIWFSIAVSNGYYKGKKSIKLLAKDYDQEQIAQLDSKVQAWLAAHPSKQKSQWFDED